MSDDEASWMELENASVTEDVFKDQRELVVARGLESLLRSGGFDPQEHERKQTDRLREQIAVAMAECDRVEAERAKHRVGCSKRPCADCYYTTCEMCGTDIPYSRLSNRHPLCDSCIPIDNRSNILKPALNTIPPRYSEMTFESADLPGCVAKGHGAKFIRDAKAAVDDPAVVFVGPPGVGKTVLTVCMLRELIKRAMDLNAPEAFVRKARDAVFMDSFTLNSTLARHPLGQGDPPLLTKALEASLLILDDLGGETGVRQDAIREVIHLRHRDCKPMWVTSFMSPKEAAEAYGGGIARRLFEEATVIKIAPHERKEHIRAF